jgi:inositol-phosphate transport system ATP-binding protein
VRVHVRRGWLMARIELDGVAKRFGEVVAVEPTDLVIEEGEFVAILGPSGCGKSTTLFMLAGLYAPSDGEIRFDGAVVNQVEARHRNVGIVFQSYALYPHMSAERNIRFPLKFKGVASGEAERRVREAAALVQVEELLDRMPAEMSGGQQQRIALARALVKEPGLLLLDEPLSNLDAALRLSMRTEIKRLQRKLGVTTVLVTHDQIEATSMADRIICMSKGRIEQIGTADDLYHRPDSRFVAGFLGAPPMNLLDGEAGGGAVRIAGATIASTGRDGSVTVGIRPEHVVVDPHEGQGQPAEVIQVEPMGRETLYVLETPLGIVRALATQSEQSRATGDRVDIRLPVDRLLLFDRISGRRIEGELAA